MKLKIIEIKNCGECPYSKIVLFHCGKCRNWRQLEDNLDAIPQWCPLSNKASCEREAEEISEEMVDNHTFTILEWFRNYVRNLERKFPNPTVEEQGWLGNIRDMIHMAGKEEWAKTTLDSELRKVKEEIWNLFEDVTGAGSVEQILAIPKYKYNSYWKGKGIE